ncbi:MAG: glycosyltransferase family 2 protein, partial [Marinicella sp.]
MKTLIVIPAFNEAENLMELLPKLQQNVEHDIVIIDDSSVDETEKIVTGFGIKCFTLPIQLGAWGATQTGIRYAEKMGYEQVITMDADGQHLPNEVDTLLQQYLNTGSNVIIGTFPSRLSQLKKLAWRFFKMLT